ncbi:MAG TPA: c-type cytochrome [Candidatus Acidoferrales bacterium]|nr:c-type cytochrome [Candidatus Acidoferrales bacterium]
MPELPPDDPIKSRSHANWILVAVFVLLLCVTWSFYAEFIGLRPWRSYQHRFASSYSAYLQKQIRDRQAAEKSVYSSPDYQKLSAALQQAEAAAKPQDAAIQKQISVIDEQRAAVLPSFQTDRSLVGSLIYDYEIVPNTASYRREKQSKFKDVQEAEAKTYAIDWPEGDGNTVEKRLNYNQLNDTFNQLLDQKAQLTAKEGDVDKPVKDAQDAMAKYAGDKLPGLNATQLHGLLNTVQSMDVSLIQINVNPPGREINDVGGVGLTDRCQSCHVGMNPKYVPTAMTLTKADLGLQKNNNAPFTSHPDSELFQWHPLDKFGCSPCHGGNGRALTSVETAHGRYEHWLWPLNYPENYDAGCQQCHSADAWTEHAPVLNEAKILYREKGCIGCHNYAGFDDQSQQLQDTVREIASLEKDKADDNQKIPQLNKAGDQAANNDDAQKLYAQATNLTVNVSKIDARVEQLDELTHSLQQEVKRVAPDLKEVRMKLNPQWIPYWLGHTWQFDPTTKMPQFRLQPDEVQAISAFIWQQGLKGPALQKQPSGDVAAGKEKFDSLGCLACHSIGEGSEKIGGDVAANLSRVGEKANYDYIVRWIHNPRVRTQPYCPYEHKDIGPADYAKHNLPYVFDVEHSKCPNDGHELVVEQQTIMPDFRLSWQEARDIASYLMTQRSSSAHYEQAAFVDDANLYAKGKTLVEHYGCAGCHEISGLEDAARIGTELTTEGSKPIGRFDYALLYTKAQEGVLPNGKKDPRGSWYDLKGFFDQKLANPAVFDEGKYKPNPMDRLRMPKPNIDHAQIDALTSFLLGSTESTLPPSYQYTPADQRKYIQQGWWIVTKYNCIGCHQIDIGQKSVLMGLPMYQADNAINLPPVLTSEGARVNPEWLKRFLANPSLSATDQDRNGVRSYLKVRMPTFVLSDDEIRKLVLFFGALSSQQQPFIPQKLAPLTDQERMVARAIFTSPAAPCLKCHATGNAAHDKNATAPNFLLAGERLRAAWTERWITEPATIIPGTAMPSGLFVRQDGRWVFNGALPAAAHQFTGDEAELLVRYLLQLTPQEQAAISGRTPSASKSASSAAKK